MLQSAWLIFTESSLKINNDIKYKNIFEKAVTNKDKRGLLI